MKNINLHQQHRQKVVSKFFSILFTSILLVISGSSIAAVVDFNNCEAGTIPIVLPAGITVTESITAANAPGGNLSWAFDVNPSPFGGVACAGTSPDNCDGVVITLPPDAAASQVDLTGAPTSSAGGFTMTLEASVGVTGCLQDFIVSFVFPEFEAVLVLDRSGSMGSSNNVSLPATTRWEALESSVNNFADPHFVDAGSTSTSIIGMTLFNGAVISNNSFTSGMQNIDNTLPTLIDNELTSQSPGGSTAMGKGIENALTKFVDATNPRTILLFTDGEQNVSPYVDINGLYLNNTGTSGCAAPGPDCTEIPTDINVVTVGIGQPSGDYLTTLMTLASTHNGYSIITPNGEDYTWGNGALLGSVQDAFTQAIAPVLSQNSPQMVSYSGGNLVAENPVSVPAFELNNFLGGLVVQVSFSQRFEIPTLVGLLTGIRIEKDGTDVTQYFSPSFVGNFTNTITLKTNFSGKNQTPVLPRLDSNGSYVVHLAKSSDIKDMSFKLAAFADDHLLDMQWKVPGQPKVMEAFLPQLNLSWMGQAIESANVNILILKSGDDLGDLLANYGATIDPSSAPDAGTAGYQKYMHLLENDPDFLAKLLPSEQSFNLNHQGGGLYQGSYNPGDISGVYQLLYEVDYSSPETGVVKRIGVQSIYVRFGDLDIESSNVVSSTSGNNTIITMKPISTVGKLIGPGQQHAFSFLGSGLSVSNVTDHQDGRYTFVVNGDSGQTVDITLLGETVFTGVLNDFNSQQPIQWWWLIIILAFLFLIWLLRKLFGNSSP